MTSATIGFAAAASVTGSTSLATFNYKANHTKGETLASAVNIGNLTEANTAVKGVADSSGNGTNSYNVTVPSGSNLYLGLQNIDTLYTNVKILDDQGNVVADSSGDAYLQHQYNQAISGGGLTTPAGDYTVQLSNTAGSVADQAADFSTTNTLGTSLSVNSQLSAVNQQEYYNFALQGNNIKLAFQNTTNTSTAQVQLYNSSGQLVADNRGNSVLQKAFSDLTSGSGLTTTAGSYVVKVSYAANADVTKNQSYNFQLYSGSSYASQYTTTASAVTKTTATDSVTATDDARVYGRTAYHTINETASSAINIGWLQQNKSSLNVISQVTAVDSTDYYSLTLQQGNNLKLAFTNQTNTSALRVQVYDGSGVRVIADNYGTLAQKAAYTALTSYSGVTEKPGTYLIKVGYAPTVTGSSGAAVPTKAKSQYYNFQVYSGTTYSASYKTIASAQTLQNAILSGETIGGVSNSFSAGATLASYLNNSLSSSSSSTPISIFGSTTI